MKLVYTFDMVYVGHLDLLEYCATLGDKFVVGAQLRMQ
jgi:glycerol-3-phosphate cytidylyltransferase-like family protein